MEVCPFSFDTRDKEGQLQEEKKIKEMQKGEVPKFKALPVQGPILTPLTYQKKVKNVTQAEPFSLETDKRGAYKAEMWKQQLEEEPKQQKEAVCLKAHPNTIFQERFVPRKEKKSVAENLSGSLVQEPFQLAIEKRAKECQEMEKRMAEMKALKMQQLEEVRQQEEEELARLRKELTHKANPICRDSAVEVKSSELPLTVPVSPQFFT